MAQMSSKKYVYLLIFVSFTLMFFSSSVKNVFQVWFVDICTSFGVTRAEFSLSGVTFMMITGVGAWVAGLLSDRLGVRKTILLGNVLIALSFIGSALIANFYAFVAIYGGFLPLLWRRCSMCLWEFWLRKPLRAARIKGSSMRSSLTALGLGLLF